MNRLAAPADLKQLYAPNAVTPSIVDVPRFKFLMVDGQGDPNTSAAFRDAIQALYPLAYGVHFALKKAGIESHVSPLEALWWAQGKGDLLGVSPAKWQWTAMIRQPQEVTEARFEQVRAEAQRKQPAGSLEKVRLEEFEEGLSAQIMHVGPYSAEGPTIERLRAFIAEKGYRPRGRHHEIYLGDPRRARPEKLKTAVRQPIER
jgi:hypothetical protein